MSNLMGPLGWIDGLNAPQLNAPQWLLKKQRSTLQKYTLEHFVPKCVDANAALYYLHR
jgi:hypothetical protein